MHPRRGARGDGSLGPPNAHEKELLEVCQQVAELAPQKFSTVREAFRYLRPDHNGKVSRSQVQYFFRAYGVERVQADRLYHYFVPDENDLIDGHQFIDFFRQYINPGEEGGVCQQPPARQPAAVSPAAPGAAHADPMCVKISNEFHYLLEEVREKAPQRFDHVREALRIVDGDYDGSITRSELQHFFRCFGIDELRADKFFDRMAVGGPGGVNYHAFVQVVAPFLDLPGVEAFKQLPARPQSRPQSARSRPPSNGRRYSSSQDRPGSPQAAERKEVLENALSYESPCLPALPRQDNGLGGLCTPRSQRGSRCESPMSVRGRPQQLLAQRGSSASRERPLPVCNSPRPSSSQQRCGEHKKDQAHQLLLGNFKPQSHEGCEDFKPAPPPAAGRPGRRPMGIQHITPVARKVGDVPVAQKVRDNSQGENLQPEVLAVSTSQALISGGRPVATPRRPVASPRRQPGFQGSAQCQ